MQRDMELVRQILFAVANSPHGYVTSKLSVEGYSDEQAGYHILLLMDAGLVRGLDASETNSTTPKGIIERLTWQEHEFLEAAGDEGR